MSSTEIVFRRKVRMLWLEQALALAASGVDWESARAALEPEVAAENAGKETIRKVLEHIKRIWFDPPPEAAALLQDALMLSRRPEISAKLLCWGMAIAAYPFVGSVAENLGRLIRLQGKAPREDVQRRMREQYGDREYVNRITRYTISSFLDWGVVGEEGRAGDYSPGPIMRLTSPEMMIWLSEALMLSRSRNQLMLSEVFFHPALFPFSMELFNPQMIQEGSRLKMGRQGLNQDFIFRS
jgi:hypothetical protein